MTDTKITELTEALYRVTDRMDDQDSLKWRLRAQALELLEESTKKSKSISFRNEEALDAKRQILLENITVMLRLASSISYIARVNFETLLREYQSLEIKSANAIPEVVFENNKIAKPVEHFAVSSVSTEQEPPQVPTERQKKILDYLAEKRIASVGELAAFFENSVSEKTLQRDLGDLVQKGQARADGEKRWRVYSIVE
jgi:hypothetical protein